jgi:hypothetical protein
LRRSEKIPEPRRQVQDIVKEPGVIKIYHQMHNANKKPTKVWSDGADTNELMLRAILE